MKRIILCLALVISVMGVSAQKANVSKAKSKTLATTPDFNAARELIKPALTDPSTKDDANTWYVAGLIGEKENEALFKAGLLEGKSDFKYDKRGPVILESIEYYLKADELGQLPDEKGKVKNKFRKDIQKAISNYYLNGTDLAGSGAALYDKKKYAEAYKFFDTYLGVPSLTIMEGVQLPKDSLYFQIQYFAALSAHFDKNMHQEAINSLRKSIANDYEKYTCYQLLYDEYRQLEDTVSFVQVLKDGFETFSSDVWFSSNLINHYISTNQIDVAVKYLDEAIAKDPTIAEYYFTRARLKEEQKDVDAANADYDNALKVNPNLAGAHAGKGRLLFNNGVEIQNNAQTIRDNKLYNAEVAKSEALIKKALPLYLKAEELDANELEYKLALQQIYYRLQMDDKYAEIVKTIKALKDKKEQE
jgi:Tfp pilus assembly protein PilF